MLNGIDSCELCIEWRFSGCFRCFRPIFSWTPGHPQSHGKSWIIDLCVLVPLLLQLLPQKKIHINLTLHPPQFYPWLHIRSPDESSLDMSLSQGDADIQENDDAAERRARRKSKLVNQLDSERSVLEGGSPSRKRPAKSESLVKVCDDMKLVRVCVFVLSHSRMRQWNILD